VHGQQISRHGERAAAEPVQPVAGPLRQPVPGPPASGPGARGQPYGGSGGLGGKHQGISSQNMSFLAGMRILFFIT
jgi:hypothetical protein